MATVRPEPRLPALNPGRAMTCAAAQAGLRAQASPRYDPDIQALSSWNEHSCAACIGAGEQLPALLQVLRRHRQGHTFTLAALSYDLGHEREHAREHAIPHGYCVSEAALAQAVGQDAAAWAGQLAATALPAPPQGGSEAQPAQCAPAALPQAAPAAGELLRTILSPPPSAAAEEELPAACGEACRGTRLLAVLQALSAGADQGQPPAARRADALARTVLVRLREAAGAVYRSLVIRGGGSALNAMFFDHARQTPGA